MPLRERVLVIDDEQDIREIVSQILSERYQVFLAQNAEDGIACAHEVNPSVVLLDMRMPGISGIEACRRLREDARTRNIPVVMLTGMDDVDQRIAAFDAGADDFVSKPFLPEELLARVSSKMRRRKEIFELTVSDSDIYFGDLRISIPEIKVFIKEKLSDIGPLEFKLLLALARNEGRLVARTQLAELLWGTGESASDRALDPHISSLRKKLRSSNTELKTIYGAGYALVIRNTMA